MKDLSLVLADIESRLLGEAAGSSRASASKGSYTYKPGDEVWVGEVIEGGPVVSLKSQDKAMEVLAAAEKAGFKAMRRKGLLTWSTVQKMVSKFG